MSRVILGPSGYAFRGKTHPMVADLAEVVTPHDRYWRLSINSDRLSVDIQIDGAGLLEMANAFQLAAIALQQERYEPADGQP